MLQLVTYNVRTNNAYNTIYDIMQETILYHTGDDVMHDAKKRCMIRIMPTICAAKKRCGCLLLVRRHFPSKQLLPFGSVEQYLFIYCLFF